MASMVRGNTGTRVGYALQKAGRGRNTPKPKPTPKPTPGPVHGSTRVNPNVDADGNEIKQKPKR